MIPVFKKYSCAACAALIALSLCGCGKTAGTSQALPVSTERVTLPTAPLETAPTEISDKALVEELAVVMSAGELYTLGHYPNLKSVDLSGSTCYDAILDYMGKHPDLDVTYSVSLGSTDISSKAASATLKPGSFDYDTLLENLQYLPNLTTISLPEVTLDAAQVSAILEAYPQIQLEYTVELLGSTYDTTTTTIDLSQMSSSQVAQAVPKLGLLTGLTDVELSSELSMEDVAKLQDANPDATFHYSFSLFGKTLSTTDTQVTYKNHTIGNDGEAQLRKALAILDDCSRFLLEDCGIDYEVLAAIREDFRDGPKVVWRVYFGKDNRYSFLTDTDTLRAVYNVTDDTCGPMKYCEDVKYMDIGHNDTLTDLSFIGYMPNIEVVIASGCAATELPGFENCKKLTWLELAYCYKLENIESLSGCESLRFLNLSYSKVTSFLSLDSLPLERFVYLSPKANKEERNIFKEIHEDCLTVFYGQTNPYGYGWRYDDHGYTFSEYYKTVIREVFNLDYLESLLPKN